MSGLLLATVVAAASLVILSGVWVTVALIAAVWRVDRRDGAADAPSLGKNTE
jgi:hypothetical protein